MIVVLSPDKTTAFVSVGLIKEIELKGIFSKL